MLATALKTKPLSGRNRTVQSHPCLLVTESDALILCTGQRLPEASAKLRVPTVEQGVFSTLPIFDAAPLVSLLPCIQVMHELLRIGIGVA